MTTHRISVDIDEEDHRYLKMCCAKIGVTIKDFVIDATIDRIDEWEKEWVTEKLESGVTRRKKEK